MIFSENRFPLFGIMRQELLPMDQPPPLEDLAGDEVPQLHRPPFFASGRYRLALRRECDQAMLKGTDRDVR
jgi:hypothetical protein